jgi:hypothetical protein
MMKKFVILLFFLSIFFSLTLEEYVYNHLYENETYEIGEGAYNLRYYYIVVVDGNLSKSFVVGIGENFYIVDNETLIQKILENYYFSRINSSEMEEFKKQLLMKIDAFDKSRKEEKECVRYFQNCVGIGDCGNVAVSKNLSRGYAEAISNLTINSEKVDALIRPFAYNPESFEQMLATVMEVNILSQRNTRNPLVLDGICGPFEYNTTALIEAREMLEGKRTMMSGMGRINETANEMAEQGKRRELLQPKTTGGTEAKKSARFEITGETFKDEGVTITFRSGVERIANEKITITYPSGKKLAMRTDYAGGIKIKLSEAGTYFVEAENYALENSTFDVRVREEQNYDIVIYGIIVFLLAAYLMYAFILAPRKTSSS